MTAEKIFSLKKINWVVLFFILAFSANLFAKDSVEKKKKMDGKQPIHIVSDRLDAYNEKKMVVFSGNAVATQFDRIIKSDQLLLYYRKETEKTAKATLSHDEMGELEKIEAKGHVTITQGERIVTGDHAVYLQDSQKIIMTGNAVMREGRNVVRGDRITVFIDEDRGIVDSADNKRVKAVIYPDDDKKRKDDQH